MSCQCQCCQTSSCSRSLHSSSLGEHRHHSNSSFHWDADWLDWSADDNSSSSITQSSNHHRGLLSLSLSLSLSINRINQGSIIDQSLTHDPQCYFCWCQGWVDLHHHQPDDSARWLRRCRILTYHHSPIINHHLGLLSLSLSQSNQPKINRRSIIDSWSSMLLLLMSWMSWSSSPSWWW